MSVFESLSKLFNDCCLPMYFLLIFIDVASLICFFEGSMALSFIVWAALSSFLVLMFTWWPGQYFVPLLSRDCFCLTAHISKGSFPFAPPSRTCFKTFHTSISRFGLCFPPPCLFMGTNSLHLHELRRVQLPHSILLLNFMPLWLASSFSPSKS